MEQTRRVAHVIADALHAGKDNPGTVARAIAPYAATFGLQDGDGLALLHWLLDLVQDPQRDLWLAEARETYDGHRHAANHDRTHP